MMDNFLGLLLGTGFGFILTAGRLTDFNTIFNTLLFKDFTVFLVMASAVGVAAPVLALLRWRKVRTLRQGEMLQLFECTVDRSLVLGSIAFGLGWGIAGTCPGPALAMLGEGRILGVAVILGLFLGIRISDKFNG